MVGADDGLTPFDISSINCPLMATEKPIGVAIIVCDKVISEAVSNNKTLISIFNTINAEKFPCAHDRMSVYVALSNGQGKKQVSLVLKEISNGNPAPKMRLSGNVQFDDPNRVVELIFNMRRIVFAAPGIYAFEVLADNEYIFESRFNVVQLKTEQS